MKIGERVGDYEIIEVLGAGGMGEVYKVRNVLSDRIEAMKVVLPNMSSNPDLAQRFLREIKVQAALDHPNIARLHTAQQFGDQLFMIMEFVEGSSLEKLLERGPLPLHESVNYVSQVLDALGYAHAQGVVHRDIKPANIMRTLAGNVKLMDFGIARMTADQRLTRTGHTVGSLFYMSPEQIQGGEPDPRSDLYALGVTLYEMVTGRKPFQGDSDYSIMAAHLEKTPVAPFDVVAGLPTDLSDIILMAIAKNPESRFQSAAAFRAALGNVVLPAGAPTGQTMTVVLPVPSAKPAVAQPAPIPAPLPAAPPPPLMSRPAPIAPPPVAVAPIPSPVVPAVTTPPPSGSRRGLYMTLGSIATLLVLAVAILEVPKFLKTRAAQGEPKAALPKVDVNATPPPAPPAAPASDSTPAPAPAGANSAAAATNTAPPAPPSTPAQEPAAAPSGSPAGNLKAQATPEKAAAAPQRRTSPVAQQQIRAPQAPPAAAQQTAPSGQQATTPPQQSASPAQPARASAAELNELREQFNQLSIRAGGAKNGLRSMQQQMAAQGLGLRGDMLETESRMDYQMKEAMDYIRNGDAEQARATLRMAQRAVETLEKFLGR